MNCRDKALSYLAMREHTKKELKTKLLTKDFTEIEIDKVLKDLEEKNLLSEKRFCESFLRSRFKKTPEPKSLLIMRLREKGISNQMAIEEIEDFYETQEEFIKQCLFKYFSKTIAKKGREKGFSSLQQKGFSYRQINELVPIEDEEDY